MLWCSFDKACTRVRGEAYSLGIGVGHIEVAPSSLRGGSGRLIDGEARREKGIEKRGN